MPQRVKKILIIGQGPIIIGQGAEYDYAGVEACKALKEEGYKVILISSNPATIMTDPEIADKVYMEPLTLEYVARIIRYERPNGLLANVGGPTAFSIVTQLAKKGVLKGCQVELLGIDLTTINLTTKQNLFHDFCEKIDEPILPAKVANNLEEATSLAIEIGFPLLVKPVFPLDGAGGGFVTNSTELKDISNQSFKHSSVNQILLEKSIKGYKEIEVEVVRDADDKVLAISCLENINPLGVHTGDSITVMPDLSLNLEIRNQIKKSAIKIIRELDILGNCNIQFAVDPQNQKYYVLKAIPQITRSSVFISKASAYSIPFVTTKLALGKSLAQITINDKQINHQSKTDSLAIKIPRFSFDKFVSASNVLSNNMKSTGEVMALGSSFEEALLKGIRSLEINADHLYLEKFLDYNNEELFEYINVPRDDQIFAIAELLRRDEEINEIAKITNIAQVFLEKIKKIIACEKLLESGNINLEHLQQLKATGFSDSFIAKQINKNPNDLINYRLDNNITPTFASLLTQSKKRIDDQGSNCFYSTYENSKSKSNRLIPNSKTKKS